MSNISSKISSIEPDDNAAARSLGLRPAGDKDGETPDAPEIDPIPIPVAPEREPDPVPDFITRDTLISPSIPVPNTGWINLTLITGVVLWLICSAVLIFGFFDFGTALNTLRPLQVAGIILFVLGPLLLIWITGYALNRLAQIAHQSYRLQETAERLMTPDDTAVSRTSIMSQSIQTELDGVNQKIDVALTRMARLQETLATQVQSIDRTSYITENKTDLIATRLSEERNALVAIASTFDDRMNALSTMLDTHSANLVKSTQEAEQKIQEARISVEGAAAKINSASEIVRGNTVEAATTLESNQSEISRLGEELKTRSKELDAVYRKHASDLASMISDLRDEQENLGISLEARLQKMRDMSLSAQVSAEHLSEASEAGRATVEALADAARLTDSAVKTRFAEMEDMVRYSNSRAEKISETAARRVQDSLAQTRKEISRIEYDMVALQDRLNQSADAKTVLQPEPENGNELKAPTPAKIEPVKTANRKRRGLSGLRPVIEKDVEEQPDPEMIKSTTPTLIGLRPATNIDDIEPESTDEDIDISDELAIPPASETDDNETAPTGTPQLEPEADINLSQETDTASFELDVEPPKEADFLRPDPDAEIKNFNPDLMRRAVPDDLPRKKQTPSQEPKQSWWKSLFSPGQKEDTFAIDQLTAPSQEAPDEPHNTETNANIVPTLSALGLSPSAIVDDGCIIEAVNARVSKGPLAMSDVIMHRLEDPVRHLYISAQADPNLKDTITVFARDFHLALGPIEDNREAIRARLESNQGRAFLLCDAALNM